MNELTINSKRDERGQTDVINRIHSQGFTLVEVLIAVGISAILLYIVSDLVVQGSWQDIRLMVRQETRDATEELRQLAKSPACGINRLLGSDPVSGQALQIEFTGGVGFFNRLSAVQSTSVSQWFNEIPLNGTTDDGLRSNGLRFANGLQYGKLLVNDIRIMPLKVPTAANADFGYSFITDHQVRAQLYVAFAPQAGAVENKLQTIRYPVVLHLNDDFSAIINCSGLEELALTRQMCDYFGGNWIDDLRKCDIQSESGTPGAPITCPVNSACNVQGQYRL